ncbi:RNase adapter RapZ [Qipengyuania marisflavi]|uniref:RNase adapter RapZ n=1 Tax=Qipengyuania marisflavi TaxID=2486356 RepID=A0A5S3P6R0_9SPHN|nr:RNase adapter RapZ [Qipengyuania marisflavi]TMM48860.1 RNase adapter RapZ [Qipengyuania marisflavi]
MTSDAPSENPSARQRILLVTGLSGAGKTTTLQVLEDLGWETIDNFPVRLLGGMVGGKAVQPAPLAIGFDSRTRGFVPDEIITLCSQLAAQSDVELETLFLDCASGEIERRYNETRRPHPMARERPVLEGIKAERELLDPLRSWADNVIDSSDFASNQLQQVVREQFADTAAREMTVTVSSFGFSRGMPPLADLLFDMRFLDNPHWIAELREQTGLDDAVGAHIRRDPAFAPSFDRIADLIRTLIPHYAAQGRSYLNIAFGCTGGRHRSVYSAERAAQVLREAGFSPTVIHRNLGTRPADPLERR